MESLKRTKERRPDLLEKTSLSEEEREYLNTITNADEPIVEEK
jgi:tRNA G37 N-methylase TrmD